MTWIFKLIWGFGLSIFYFKDEKGLGKAKMLWGFVCIVKKYCGVITLRERERERETDRQTDTET